MTVEDRDIADALRTSLADWDVAPGDTEAAVRAASGRARRHRRVRAVGTTAGLGLTAAALVAGLGISQEMRSATTSVASLQERTLTARPNTLANPNVTRSDLYQDSRKAAFDPRVYAYPMKATFAPGTYGGHEWQAGASADQGHPLIEGMSCQGFDGPDIIAQIRQEVGDDDRRLIGTIAGYQTGTGQGVIAALRDDKLQCRWWMQPGWPKTLAWAGHDDADHFLGTIPNFGAGQSDKSDRPVPIGKTAVVAAARVGDLVVYGVAYDRDRASAVDAATSMVLATEQRVRSSSFPPAHGKPVPGSDVAHVTGMDTVPSDPAWDLPASVLPSSVLPHDQQLPAGLTYSPLGNLWVKTRTSPTTPRKGGFIAGTTDGPRYQKPPADDVQPILGISDSSADRANSDHVWGTQYSVAKVPSGTGRAMVEQNIAGDGSRSFGSSRVVRPVPWPGSGSDSVLLKLQEQPQRGASTAVASRYVAIRVVGDYVVSASTVRTDDTNGARAEAVKAVNDMVNNLRAAGKVK
ncbi:hypothetical protein PZ938_06160 [Luteipulveratus sp. YIM 133132]|uniref:hypothetical protein n=1 Tax=Luteipulveratus flavus TaxID=3031728 RepID=UPI0023AFDDBA|nr:hypothetical protein [Luteipulveratus sp. YIM 133132]MDE9365184.1 hypothetical protein [Luteipulveratus sp. YIM 133132]